MQGGAADTTAHVHVRVSACMVHEAVKAAAPPTTHTGRRGHHGSHTVGREGRRMERMRTQLPHTISYMSHDRLSMKLTRLQQIRLCLLAVPSLPSLASGDGSIIHC